MTTSRPLGFWTAVLCGLSVLHATATIVFLGTSTRWFQAMQVDELVWIRLLIGWTTAQLIVGLLSLAIARRARRMPRGALGRARIVSLSVAAGLHTAITTASIGLILWAALASLGHVLGGTIPSLLFGLTHLAYPDLDLEWVQTLYQTATSLQWATGTALVVLATACWFLLPLPKRERFWWVFDALMVLALVAVSFALPLTPIEGDDASLGGAVVRVTVTALFATRVALRLVGPLLSAFERIGFRPMVAA
ncbi:MAG: hypothetical protein OER77_14810, partial [Myxococcales bacterium]|nr:hypothetical protein [Myxococcales bacterium]